MGDASRLVSLGATKGHIWVDATCIFESADNPDGLTGLTSLSPPPSSGSGDNNGICDNSGSGGGGSGSRRPTPPPVSTDSADKVSQAIHPAARGQVVGFLIPAASGTVIRCHNKYHTDGQHGVISGSVPHPKHGERRLAVVTASADPAFAHAIARVASSVMVCGCPSEAGRHKPAFVRRQLAPGQPLVLCLTPCSYPSRTTCPAFGSDNAAILVTDEMASAYCNLLDHIRRHEPLAPAADSMCLVAEGEIRQSLAHLLPVVVYMGRGSSGNAKGRGCTHAALMPTLMQTNAPIASAGQLHARLLSVVNEASAKPEDHLAKITQAGLVCPLPPSPPTGD